MTRLLPGGALLLTVLFTLLIVVMRVQPFDEALADQFGDCTAPCWQGIEPGATSGEAALTRISGLPVSSLCFSRSSAPCEMYQWTAPAASAGAAPETLPRTTGIQIQQGTVQSVTVKAPGFTLGSVLLTLDGRDHLLYDVQVGYNFDRMYLWLTFSDASIGVSARANCPTSYLTLMRAPVEMIVIQTPNVNRPHVPTRLSALRRTVYHLCER